MAVLQTYRDLVVWQRAMDLVELTYRTTQKFPREEMYGLTSQLRRASVSIPSNIAEGQARASSREFGQFLRIAYGSLRELETQCMIARRLEYIDDQELDRLLEFAGEVGRLLVGLIESQAQ